MKARMSVRSDRAVAAQVEDAALHLVGPRLRQLDQPVGLELGLLHHGSPPARRAFSRMSSDAFWAVRSVFLRMVSRSRVLVDHVLQALDLLLEGVALALERGYLLGHERQIGPHLFAVEAAELAREGLPLDVHGRDLHVVLRQAVLVPPRVARRTPRLKDSERSAGVLSRIPTSNREGTIPY